MLTSRPLMNILPIMLKYSLLYSVEKEQYSLKYLKASNISGAFNLAGV